MREYALITLNIIEYAGIYLKKQSAEYARILNVSDAVYSIRSLYCTNITDLAVIETERYYSEQCQIFKMEDFAKRNSVPECTCATRNFSGQERGVLWNSGTPINILSKTYGNKAPQGNILLFFLLDTL